MEENPSYRLRVRDGVRVEWISVGRIKPRLKRSTGSDVDIRRNYAEGSLDIYLGQPASLSGNDIEYLSFWGTVEEVKKELVN